MAQAAPCERSELPTVGVTVSARWCQVESHAPTKAAPPSSAPRAAPLPLPDQDVGADCRLSDCKPPARHAAPFVMKKFVAPE